MYQAGRKNQAIKKAADPIAGASGWQLHDKLRGKA